MEGFSFTLPYQVRIADINYGGHVSNAAILSYFQDGRIAYLGALGPFSELDIGGGCGLIMAESQVRYHAELFHGDELLIGVRAAEVRRSAFVLEYRIERAAELASEGRTVMICFDYAQRKARRLPQVLRDAMVALDNPLQPQARAPRAGEEN